MRPEVVPILLVALLLLSTQTGVDTFTTVVGGTQEIEGGNDAVLVVDGNLTVAEGERVDTSLYVIGGAVDVRGTIEGDILQLSGEVRATASATVTGSYQILGGTQSLAAGSSITPSEIAEPLTQPQSVEQRLGVLFVQAVGLALAGFVVGRRYTSLVGNVGHSIRRHPIVSATVGLLASVSLLALFVFMAFTLVLIPVSILGVLGGILVFLYGYVAIGYVIGRTLGDERPGAYTAGGTVVFLLTTELLAFVPYVGGLVPVVALLVSVGAVFVTYFGLREFHPPEIQPVADDES